MGLGRSGTPQRDLCGMEGYELHLAMGWEQVTNDSGPGPGVVT